MAIDFKSLSPEQKQYANLIATEAEAAGIDPNLALAQAYQESGFNHYAGDGKEKKILKSESDAYGLMQITPDTAKTFGVNKDDLLDPNTNVRLGMQIMKKYLDKYGRPDYALMAYHQGEGTVDKYIEKDFDPKVLGPKGKDYIQIINGNYDLNQNSGLVEEEDFEDRFTEPAKADVEEKAPEAKPDIGSSVFDAVNQSLQAHPASYIAGPMMGLAQGARNTLGDFTERRMQRAPAPPVDLEAQFKAQQAGDPNALTPGEKWSQKVVGTLGPGGESSTEAARNYRIQQGLQIAPDVENPRYQPNRFGVILPRGVQEQVDLQKQAELQRQAEEALKKVSPLDRVMDRVKSIPTNINSGVNSPLVKGLSRSPLATALSGGLGLASYEQAQQLEAMGDLEGARRAKIKAVMELAGSIPVRNPYLGALKLGTLGTGLGMEGYDYLKDKFFPYQSVTKLKR